MAAESELSYIPKQFGHRDFPGCFRCHDGSHTATDGQTITPDCSACYDWQYDITYTDPKF
jgi:hypothetical protein